MRILVVEDEALLAKQLISSIADAGYVVDHAAFQELLETRPELAEDISRVLGERMLALTNQQDITSLDLKVQRAAEASGRVLVKIRKFFNLH